MSFLLTKSADNATVDFTSSAVNIGGAQFALASYNSFPWPIQFMVFGASGEGYNYTWGDGLGVSFSTGTVPYSFSPGWVPSGSKAVISTTFPGPATYDMNFKYLPVGTATTGPDPSISDGTVTIPSEINESLIDFADSNFQLQDMGNCRLISSNTTGAIGDPFAEFAQFKVWSVTLDGTPYNSYISFPGEVPGHITIQSDGVWNYSISQSLYSAPPVTDPFWKGRKWQSKPFDVSESGDFSAVEDFFELSDPTDDALLQAALRNLSYEFGNQQLLGINSNTQEWFLTIGDTPPFSTVVVFAFSQDFTTYRRIDVTFDVSVYNDGSNLFPVYTEDVDGEKYIGGERFIDFDTDPTGVSEVWQILGGGVGGNTELRCWGFTLDGHDFYVVRLGGTATLVYDLTAQRWSEWRTEGLDNWRPICGTNWQGMAGTLADGGTAVVAGDDTTGVLWRLDPAKGRDDLTTSGDQAFTRSVIGGIPLSGRAVLPCGALELTCALGAPSQTGAAFDFSISDDLGQTWIDCGSQTVVAEDFTAVIECRALGTAKAPGRLFRITDNGASVRIGRATLR